MIPWHSLGAQGVLPGSPPRVQAGTDRWLCQVRAALRSSPEQQLLSCSLSPARGRRWKPARVGAVGAQPLLQGLWEAEFPGERSFLLRQHCWEKCQVLAGGRAALAG